MFSRLIYCYSSAEAGRSSIVLPQKHKTSETPVEMVERVEKARLSANHLLHRDFLASSQKVSERKEPDKKQAVKARAIV